MPNPAMSLPSARPARTPRGRTYPIILALFTTCAHFHAGAQALESPPIVPSPDEVIVPSHQFVTHACRREMDRVLARLHAQLGTSVLTQGARWGDVWRGDFLLPGDGHLDGVNRLICWLPRSRTWTIEIAIGQQVAPLRNVR